MEKTLNHTLPNELVLNDLALSSTEAASDNQRKGKRGKQTLPGIAVRTGIQAGMFGSSGGDFHLPSMEELQKYKGR